MEPNRKVIKQYFWNNDIKFVKLHLDIGLMICHKNTKKGVKWRESESELSIEEKEIQKYLKKTKEVLTREEVETWTDIEVSNSGSSKPTNWTLIISLGLIAVWVILLVGLIIFFKKRKRV